MFELWMERLWTVAADGGEERDSPFETRGQAIAGTSRTLELIDGQQES
jgi:hypothetical protein